MRAGSNSTRRRERVRDYAQSTAAGRYQYHCPSQLHDDHASHPF